jgi:primase-polymerase (primpol)-like protein
MRSCLLCRSSLSPLVQSSAKFCGDRCRQRAHRAQVRPVFPVELLELSRWIRRSVDKIPLQVSGRNASSTAPKTWSSYAAASSSSVGAGLGFVLNGDGIVCVDLDHCLGESSVVAGWARQIVDSIPGTFVEVSPSGDGLHVWGRSSFAGGRRFTVDGGGVEIYSTARYLTMTGRKFRGSKDRLADLDGFIEFLLGGCDG